MRLAPKTRGSANNNAKNRANNNMCAEIRERAGLVAHRKSTENENGTVSATDRQNKSCRMIVCLCVDSLAIS